MATDLNIPGAQTSAALHVAIAASGATAVLLDNSLHVEGTPEQIAAAQTVAASFDLAAGVFADKVTQYEAAVQAHLDSAAEAVGYDNILSACSYAGYANPFQAEGQSFLVWRGAVWQYCYAQVAAIQAQQRAQPTVAELIAELPVRA